MIVSGCLGDFRGYRDSFQQLPFPGPTANLRHTDCDDPSLCAGVAIAADEFAFDDRVCDFGLVADILEALGSIAR